MRRYRLIQQNKTWRFLPVAFIEQNAKHLLPIFTNIAHGSFGQIDIFGKAIFLAEIDYSQLYFRDGRVIRDEEHSFWITIWNADRELGYMGNVETCKPDIELDVRYLVNDQEWEIQGRVRKQFIESKRGRKFTDRLAYAELSDTEVLNDGRIVGNDVLGARIKV